MFMEDKEIFSIIKYGLKHVKLNFDNFLKELENNIQIIEEFEEYIKDALFVSKESMSREYTI